MCPQPACWLFCLQDPAGALSALSCLPQSLSLLFFISLYLPESTFNLCFFLIRLSLSALLSHQRSK